VKRHDDLERDTLENFAYNVVQDSSNSVKGYLQRIHGIMFDRGLLKLLSDDVKVCGILAIIDNFIRRIF
jgi:hypothetical protein